MTAGSQVQTAYTTLICSTHAHKQLGYTINYFVKKEGSMLHLRIGTSSAFAQKAAINVNV